MAVTPVNFARDVAMMIPSRLCGRNLSTLVQTGGQIVAFFGLGQTSDRS